MEPSEQTPNGHDLFKFEPGSLWSKLQERTAYALQTGALQPIPTDYEFVEEQGVTFLVRVLSNIFRKEQSRKKQTEAAQKTGKPVNPFLPYEEDLYVTDISDTHVCLLNKFNVADYHFLIITRAFEEQDSLLTQPDFEAMWACLADVEGLAFYNGGKDAGASQRHKHLQIVPLPLVPEGPPIPTEVLLSDPVYDDAIATLPSLPFQHAFIRFEDDANSPVERARITLDYYLAMLHRLNLYPSEMANVSAPGPYNLLATKDWMLIVPRSQEHFETVSINSLGFAGTLFARDEAQLQILKNYGPMTILKNVAVPLG